MTDLRTWRAWLEADILDTTDATPTASASITTEDDYVYAVEILVIGRRTGGSAGTTGDSAVFFGQGAFKDIGGTLSALGTSITDPGSDMGSVAIAVNGSDIEVQITGAANNNIRWRTFYRYEKLLELA